MSTTTTRWKVIFRSWPKSKKKMAAPRVRIDFGRIFLVKSGGKVSLVIKIRGEEGVLIMIKRHSGRVLESRQDSECGDCPTAKKGQSPRPATDDGPQLLPVGLPYCFATNTTVRFSQQSLLWQFMGLAGKSRRHSNCVKYEPPKKFKIQARNTTSFHQHKRYWEFFHQFMKLFFCPATCVAAAPTDDIIGQKQHRSGLYIIA